MLHILIKLALSCYITISHTDNDSVNVVHQGAGSFSASGKRKRDKPTVVEFYSV